MQKYTRSSALSFVEAMVIAELNQAKGWNMVESSRERDRLRERERQTHSEREREHQETKSHDVCKGLVEHYPIAKNASDDTKKV